MNGPIAQAVALTCHGNAALYGILGAASFLRANSTCQFCDEVTFVRVKRTFLGKMKEERVAATPDAWFEALKRDKTRGLRLVRETGSGPLSDCMSAGFVGGGGTWFIEAIGSDGASRFWAARWDVWNQNAPERRIWRVAYGLVADRKTVSANGPNVASTSADLLGALTEIEAFARETDCGHFADCFAKAIEALTAEPDPQRGYHRDLAPHGLISDSASRALDACQSAWVFGGMGSWNDLGFEGNVQERYERVSNRLFGAVNAAIEAATNTSFGDGASRL